jgi:bacterial/archaeal transporter family protein
MDWVAASLISAFFLGCYELFTKHAVNGNAVLPVLFLSTLCGAVVWLGLLLGQNSVPVAFQVQALSARGHGLLLLKSFIVTVSWTCTYFAVKHLPVSLVSPIRATGPMWTLAGALVLLGERLTLWESLGVLVTLISFFALSLAGRSEGIHFHRNRWIFWAVIGTLFNGISALYDKYLLGVAGFDAATVQCWFSIYLALLFLPLAVGWWFQWWPRQTFHWRWSIPLITGALLVADYIYFDALRDPDALISVVASFRRGSTLVALIGGFWLFRERNARQKLPAAFGILIGIILTIVG